MRAGGSWRTMAALFQDEETRYTSPHATSPLFPRKTLSLDAPPTDDFTLEPQHPHTTALASDRATAFNIVNNFVGMILLSLAYCFARAGWAAAPLLAVLTALGGYTGYLIVASYITIAQRGETVPSYAKVGFNAAGPWGEWVVLVSSIVETFFAIINMNIVTWKNVELLLPSVEPSVIILGCVLLSAPTNLLKDFNRLSFLSAFGLACIIFICAVVAYQLLLLWVVDSGIPPGDDKLPDRSMLVTEGLPMAASIMLAGLTGHVSLPPIYASMKTPSHFKRIITLSFVAMFFLYAFVGVCGYGLYGSENHVIITIDMTQAARSIVDRLLVTCILVGMTFKLFCSVPMCIVVLTDIAENVHLQRTGQTLHEKKVMRVRILTWLAGVLLSVIFYDSLEYVTAFIGINSLFISIILPIAFYWAIHRGIIGWLHSLWLALILSTSFVITVLVAYVDVSDFLDHLRGEQE